MLFFGRASVFQKGGKEERQKLQGIVAKYAMNESFCSAAHGDEGQECFFFCCGFYRQMLRKVQSSGENPAKEDRRIFVFRQLRKDGGKLNCTVVQSCNLQMFNRAEVHSR